jgi:2-(1,2-epoxy-1,2-dihydrophenyl)acetyl-CoA isomerase
VLVSIDEGVATLVLNRPAALNSFTGAMHSELRLALDAAAQDNRVRCVVLTGTGRGFCTGQDLSDIGEDGDLGRLLSRDYHPLIHRLRSMPVPTLAAVNGIAVGAGAGIALMCDIVIATASASFTFPFAKIGLIPDSGLAWALPRHVGWARAMALFMLADKVTAAEAQSCGLIWQAVEDASFQDVVRATATKLASSSSAALVATRALMDGAQQKNLEALLNDEVGLQSTRGKSQDYVEGVSAFLAKRRPRFVER